VSTQAATLLAALCLSLAVLTWLPAPRRLRLESKEQSRVRASINPRLACVLGGLAVVVLLGGWPGWLIGASLMVFGPGLLARLESRSERQRRTALLRQAPAFLDLLAAVLASGAGLESALRVVSAAIGEPTSSAVRAVTLALELGADPATAWANVRTEPALAPLAEAGIRSAASGAPLAAMLTGVASDVRRRHRSTVQVAARSAGVRAVAPLAACFLPAFLLLGVVPVIASLADQLLMSQ